MREFKFRVWHKKERKMYQVLAGSFFQGDTLFWIEVQNDQGVRARIDKKEDVEIMESTGLRDKDGKEIYEGDAVKGHHQGCKGLNFKCNCRPSVIKYGFWGSGDYAGTLGWNLRDGSVGEVIGNIYENPELLKHEITGGVFPLNW